MSRVGIVCVCVCVCVWWVVCVFERGVRQLSYFSASNQRPPHSRAPPNSPILEVCARPLSRCTRRRVCVVFSSASPPVCCARSRPTLPPSSALKWPCVPSPNDTTRRVLRVPLVRLKTEHRLRSSTYYVVWRQRHAFFVLVSRPFPAPFASRQNQSDSCRLQ